MKLRLLQVAQQLDIQMKPEQLKEFYETFECNTDLLREKNRRVSLHKLCRYIDKESERYPIGEKERLHVGLFLQQVQREDRSTNREKAEYGT